jgi:hypothetical protein
MVGQEATPMEVREQGKERSRDPCTSVPFMGLGISQVGFFQGVLVDSFKGSRHES